MIDGTNLLLLFKRYKVSIVEIHLASVDNLPGKKSNALEKQSKASFKNDQREGQQTLTSCKVVKSTFMARA